MTPSWHRHLRGDERLALDGDGVLVNFVDGRSHRVAIRETEDTLELSAVVARRARLRSVEDLEIRVWRSNRLAQLNGFRLERNGRLCAFGWLAKAGLSSSEVQHVLHLVAVEADRMEFVLTGMDVE